MRTWAAASPSRKTDSGRETCLSRGAAERHGTAHASVSRGRVGSPDRSCVSTATGLSAFQPTGPCSGSDGQVHSAGGAGGWRDDAQAGMPSDEPRAQLAFKDSMIRGILQFTLRIAFRCVLHRCKSQDIRC